MVDSAKLDVLCTGDLVEIHGLQGARELNRRRGSIVTFVASTSRYGVKLDGLEEPKSLKLSNLRKLQGPIATSTKANMWSMVAEDKQHEGVDITLDDFRATTVPDDDDCAKSLPGTSKGRNRRKANLKKKMREELTHLPLKNEESYQQVSMASKAVQTDDLTVRDLLGRVAALEEIVKQQGELLQQFCRTGEGDKCFSFRPPGRGMDIETRVSYLERVEEEHSKLLVSKCKADAEMYADLDAMKSTIREIEGKVSYCMEVLEDDLSVGNEGEETEEVDQDNGAASEDYSESDLSQIGEGVPPHVRALPWVDKVRALGLLSDPAPISAPSSSSTRSFSTLIQPAICFTDGLLTASLVMSSSGSAARPSLRWRSSCDLVGVRRSYLRKAVGNQ